MTKKSVVLMLSLVLIVMTGCASDANGGASPDLSGAPDGIERYLQALVSSDADAFNTLYCAEYEAEARTEFDSFGAVEARLKDFSCALSEEQSDADDAMTLVQCQGAIEVGYNGENAREIPVDRNVYRATQEDGEWRMCGYAR